MAQMLGTSPSGCTAADFPVADPWHHSSRETTIAVPFTHGDLASDRLDPAVVAVQLARMQERGIIDITAG